MHIWMHPLDALFLLFKADEELVIRVSLVNTYRRLLLGGEVSEARHTEYIRKLAIYDALSGKRKWKGRNALALERIDTSCRGRDEAEELKQRLVTHKRELKQRLDTGKATRRIFYLRNKDNLSAEELGQRLETRNATHAFSYIYIYIFKLVSPFQAVHTLSDLLRPFHTV
ncbi:hypothetical protein N9L68_01260 [bacterium]|nr:hypothetical protein [bacterium]